MPQLQVKTVTAQSVWKSPDGQREIFSVTLEHNGQQVQAKTYSKDISNVGWEGEVETYEKPGRNGSETFVKQPPKEDGSWQSRQGSRGGTTGGSSSRPAYQPKDEKAIQAMWAIGQAVNLVGSGDNPEERVGTVYDIATQLFSMVDMVKTETTPTATDDPIPTDAVDKMIDNIDEVFNT